MDEDRLGRIEDKLDKVLALLEGDGPIGREVEVVGASRWQTPMHGATGVVVSVGRSEFNEEVWVVEFPGGKVGQYQSGHLRATGRRRRNGVMA